ncbi:hypothetical protein ACOME3_007509 [Neoechinorhynchus agilis]
MDKDDKTFKKIDIMQPSSEDLCKAQETISSSTVEAQSSSVPLSGSGMTGDSKVLLEKENSGHKDDAVPHKQVKVTRTTWRTLSLSVQKSSLQKFLDEIEVPTMYSSDQETGMEPVRNHTHSYPSLTFAVSNEDEVEVSNEIHPVSDTTSERRRSSITANNETRKKISDIRHSRAVKKSTKGQQIVNLMHNFINDPESVNLRNPLDFIRLRASDGAIFLIQKKYLLLSRTLAMVLTSKELAEDEEEFTEIQLPSISSAVLEVICRFLCYRYRYVTMKQVAVMRAAGAAGASNKDYDAFIFEPIPEFHFPSHLAAQLLNACNNLGC